MRIIDPFTRLPIKINPPRIIIFSYLSVILLGTILLSLPIATQGEGSTGFLNALFTATSAVCVTGLIVVNTASHWSLFGQITILILIQIGGLGFMTLSTLGFMLVGKRITFSERLLIKEDIGNLTYSGLVRLVRYVLALTFTVEAAGAFLLFLSFQNQMETMRAIWFAIFHAVSAFCNAGFDIFGNSLEAFTGDAGINLIFTSLIIIGGLGFTVIRDLMGNVKGKKFSFRMLSLHSKMVILITVLLLVIGSVLVFAFEFTNSATMGDLAITDKLTASFFLSVTPRTAGFNTVPTGALNVNTLFLLIILMFIGASPCSTGGGIKTTTLGAIVTNVVSFLRGDDDYNVLERRLNKEIIDRAVAIVFISAVIVILSTIILSITESAEFIDVLFESVSAFGTVGLSTGITGGLSRPGRLMIILTMLTGRIGPLTLVISLGNINSAKKSFRYAQEDIMIG
ncbi:TrkH family potassium uptake protein [Halarsenatibacter silvermanii]|uniref:Trk system potassium uptake protein TrkH n=1 Tax=Halarsenatibacter silvermanii TaxID=321763 RepID=A0A1G9KW13_9FIRM|nr:TrkH family potassium uptake protein [Halarsenatibacter silvermanii]SDL53908.1 trk system potassium uptake protein TrkH [Halarsenatibacter silvermanii]